jgi:hypothetical protein
MTHLMHMEIGKCFIIFNFYMIVIYLKNIGCWESLQDYNGSIPINAIIVVGDLNIVLKEKRGRSVVRNPMRERM